MWREYCMKYTFFYLKNDKKEEKIWDGGLHPSLSFCGLLCLQFRLFHGFWLQHFSFKCCAPFSSGAVRGVLWVGALKEMLLPFCCLLWGSPQLSLLPWFPSAISLVTFLPPTSSLLIVACVFFTALALVSAFNRRVLCSSWHPNFQWIFPLWVQQPFCILPPFGALLF